MKLKHRLRDGKDIRRLYKLGRRIDTPLFRFIFSKNELCVFRVAFVVPRSIEKRATLRNRLRRRAGEWIRRKPEILRLSLDLALLFKKEATKATRRVFYNELEELFKKILRAQK